MKTLFKLFDATLLDSSECHLHYRDFRHSLNAISFMGVHSTKSISQKFRHLQNELYFAQVAIKLRYHLTLNIIIV